MNQNRVSLAGSLNFITLGELLQFLGSTGSSGTLKITCKYVQEPGIVYLVRGNPIDASVGDAGGLDALFSLFGWTDARFEFREGTPAVNQIIHKSRMEIILDGLRMLDEGEIEKIGPVSIDPSGPADLYPMPLIRGPQIDYLYMVNEEEFSSGQEIVSEGKHGNWIWVVLEGSVQIVKDTPKGPLNLLRIGEGSFLGSIGALLGGNNLRSATAVAVGNVQLGAIDSQRLTTEYAGLSSDFRSLIKSLDARLRRVTERVVDEFLGRSDIQSFTKNRTPLIDEKRQADQLYVIRKGQASVVRFLEKETVPLLNLYPDDFCGRVPFIDMGNEPDSASVLAPADLSIEVANAHGLQDEFDGLSETFRNIIENLAACIRTTSDIVCDFHQLDRLAPGEAK